jgi:hypothetical protein
MNKFFGGKFAA